MTDLTADQIRAQIRCPNRAHHGWRVSPEQILAHVRLHNCRPPCTAKHFVRTDPRSN